MRKRLTVEKPGLCLVNAEGKRVARITTMTLELLDEDEPIQALEQEEMLDEVDEPLEVWRHYVDVMNPRYPDLDSQTRGLIRDALKVATMDECKGAVDGCKASDFHMGINDRRKKYNKPSHIFKGKRGVRTTREQIDLFLDIAAKSGNDASITSADSGRINNAKRDMQAAAEFPGDEFVAQRGSEARAWLEQQGWTITLDEDGWPMFQPPTSL